MKKRTKYPKSNKNFKIMTLDDYFVKGDVKQDVFGFLDALSSTEEVNGYFAVFDLNGSIKATEVYTKDILESMVIPDILKNHPDSYYKIFSEEDFDKIVKRKV